MNKEAQPHPSRLTLEQVAQNAQETLLREGRHIPTLIVEGRCVVTVEFPQFGATSQERQAQIMSAGFLLAREAPIGALQQAFFVAESWMSTAPQGGTITVKPSEDPQRTEVLTVSRFEVETQHMSMSIFALQRDHTGRLMGLSVIVSPADRAEQKTESTLLNAFLFGFLQGLSGEADPH